MTKEKLAEILNCREHRNEITKQEEQEAKEAGLVVVFGASDDLMEFRGAIYDEIDCYSGSIAYFDENGLLENDCDNENCPHFEKIKQKAKTIEAIWCENDEEKENPVPWTYKTEIPHAHFSLFDDNEIYCIGIVFSINDLK